MAVKSLKELQLPGSADSYTFDASLFDGKTPDLFALLRGNNEFTGKNVFSGITAIHDSEGDMTFGAKSFVLTSPEGDPVGESVLPSSDNGGQFFLAWANDESNADLSLYAKTSDLSSYVTNTTFNSTLASYVKKSGDTVTGQLLFTSSDSASRTGLLHYGEIEFANDEDASKADMTCYGFSAMAADGNGEFIHLNKSGIDYSENDGASPRTRSIFPFTGKHAKVYLAYSSSKSGAFLDEALASYVTNSSLSATLGGYAKLSGNNKFTGSNEFSNRIKIGSWLFSGGHIGSIEAGNRLDFPSKSGWFAYASDEDSANLSLYARYTDLDSYAKKSDLPTGFATLAGANKFTGSNTFTGSNDFNTGGRTLSIKEGNYCSSMGYIPFKTIADDHSFGLKGGNGAIYDLSSFLTTAIIDGCAKLSGRNSFTGSNDFGTGSRILSIKEGNYCSSMGYIPFKTIADNHCFGLKGGNGAIYDLSRFLTTAIIDGCAKLSANNTFTGSNNFNTDGRVLSIKDGNFCSNESFIPLRTISSNRNFGIRGANGTVYDLNEFPKPDSDGKLSFGGGKANSMLSIADAGRVDSAKYILLATMPRSDDTSWACVFVKGRIGGWGTNTIDIDVRIQGRDGPYITGTAQSINSWGMSAALECAEIMANTNVDNTISVWLKINNHYSYALDVRAMGAGSKVAYTGTKALVRGGTEKDRLSTSSYVMKVYGSSIVQTRDIDTRSGSIHKINGENMCNYRKLTGSVSITGEGGGSCDAYGLYVNNVLVKIVGNIALNVSSGASATVKISWDRSQPTDWNMLNHFMLTGISGSGNSTYMATTTEWNLSVSLGTISSGSRYFIVL